MWKCMMCETYNAENAESCLICNTSKADAKKYYEKLKKASVPDSDTIKASGYVEKKAPETSYRAASASKTTSYTIKSEDTVETSKASVSSRSASADWSELDDAWDAIVLSSPKSRSEDLSHPDDDIKRRRQKLRLEVACGPKEKVFMLVLLIITVVSLAIPTSFTLAWGSVLAVCVPIYVATRGVAVLNTGKFLETVLKLLIWIVLSAIFILEITMGLCIIDYYG